MFVDPTLAWDEEFTASPSVQRLPAVDPLAVARIDLLMASMPSIHNHHLPQC